MHWAMIVSSWEIVEENDKVFANYHPKAIATEHMGYNYSMFGHSAYGPYWRLVGKIMTGPKTIEAYGKMLKY